MNALYIIVKYLTFPGAYVRCMWEQFICRLWHVPVEDNRYIRKDEMAGHIEHEFMPSVRSSFAFCFVPALMNLIGTFMLGLVPSLFTIYARIDDITLTAVNLICYWFAISLFVNAFPLIEDALHMTESVYKKGNIIQKIFYAPGVAITFVGAHLEKYCVTFLLAIVYTLVLLLA